MPDTETPGSRSPPPRTPARRGRARRRGEEGPRPAALLLAGAHPHAHVTEATRQGFRRVALEMPLALTINWKKLQLLVTMLRITLYMRRYFKVGDEEAKALLPALLTPEPRDAFF